MKFLALLLFPYLLFGDIIPYNTIEKNLQKGWNLVGFSINIKKDYIKNLNFTYKKGEWIQNGDISPADGVWIFSERDETLLLPHSGSELKDSDISKISLVSGWNLISLPIQSAVSPDIFRDQKSVWKYSDGDWSQYRKDANYSEYPQIDVLGVGEGFWVFSENDEVIDISERESQLKNFSSEKAMTDYLTAMVKYNKNYRGDQSYYPYLRGGIVSDGMVMLEMAENVADSDSVSSPTSSESTNKSDSVSDITTTNTQETEVDEADIVKHDGNHIFYLPANWNENKILVTSFIDILNGDSEPITEINTSKKPSELYLIDNKLIAIYPHNTNFWSFWRNINYDIWSGKSAIEIYDVSDIQNIKQIEKFEFDGNIVNSRVTGGKLFLVSRYMPYIEVEYPKTYVECENEYCYYQKDDIGYFTSNYQNPIEKEIHTIPTMNNESMISESTLFAPSKINQTPYITSVTEFEISDFSKHNSISVVGGSETIYSSTEALYIVSSEYPIYYNLRNYEDRVTIYKFGISDGLKYSGKGFLDGRILNQFSLSEYQNSLRVATTKTKNWWIDQFINSDRTDNMVFALQEKNGTLETVGEIRGLGKENEIIRGVRFLGDKGYIVTFEQTDPLYVIDMSDPTNLVKGENPLEIDGYSTYFHPVNSELLLSLGVNANSDGRETGYQIQLFNISDFNNPKLVDKVLMPETQSTENRWNFYSEAINNHKAFTYRSSDNLFGVPLREYVREEMRSAEKREYLAENYVLFTEENFDKYEIEDAIYDEFAEKYEFELEEGYSLYMRKTDVESGHINRLSNISQIYFPNYYYKNDLKIYQVDTENSKIDFKNDILGGKESNYDYQRGIIFTYQEKNYGLYILSGKFYLSEIEK